MLGIIEKHITKNLPFLRDKKLLIAISGGLDSVVLAHVFHELQYAIGLAHCNFNLRGAESDGDEEFVKTLAKQLNTQLFTKQFATEVYANESKESIQMAARSLRYTWFKEIASQHEYDYILTAHHADDALETFLINLSRGTGIDGLTGIPEINGNIIRPLLPYTRMNLQEYATSKSIQWREDSSNASTKYIRNKIRHQIVPLLKELHPTFMENFKVTQEHLQGSKQIIEASIQNIQNDILKETEDGGFKINIDALKAIKNYEVYLYELLNKYGFNATDEILTLIKGQSGKQLFSGKYRLIKNRDFLLLQNLEKTNDACETLIINNTKTELKKPIHLKVEEVSKVTDKGNDVLYINKEKLKFPLIVRKWKNGDYFYPFGMQGKKKISKFFKDEKYSLIDKENQWLLCAEDQIIWVIGKRSDNRYRLTKPTKTIIKFTLK